jgi:hypothetical protein
VRKPKLNAYRVSDYEIYAGYDFESAVKAAMHDSGEERGSYYSEVSEPLPDDYKIMDTDEGENPLGLITVREVIDRDLSGPGMVANSY